VLQHDVADVGDGVLNGKKGDICLVSPEDFSATTDWVWVRIDQKTGYVPRSMLMRQ
jgi:hypothetical protein